MMCLGCVKFILAQPRFLCIDLKWLPRFADELWLTFKFSNFVTANAARFKR